MNFSLLDFKEKCREEELSLLILSSSDGLVLKSSYEGKESESLSAIISIIYKEAKGLFDLYLKNDKIKELYMNGNKQKIILLPFNVNNTELILIALGDIRKSMKRKLNKIKREVSSCLQEIL
jgi:predicted regulator of Ras-like GTPase activity (Roadblock/LC7/MglB family)